MLNATWRMLLPYSFGFDERRHQPIDGSMRRAVLQQRLTESNGAFRSGPSIAEHRNAHCRRAMPHRCTPNVSANGTDHAQGDGIASVEQGVVGRWPIAPRA